MAQVVEPMSGQKRGAGRPPKNATPVAKKPRLSTSFLPSPTVHPPTAGTPTTDRRWTKLPWRVADNKPLPTLPQPQAVNLSDDEYQSVAASAVLQASLVRSQAKWTQDGIFERYWTKPETGKNARPPPPNNPDAKWMKHKGECRIRIEPHIFECQMYVEEKPRPPPPPKQYVPPAQSAYGQPYRPPQQQQYAPAHGHPYQPQTQPPSIQALQQPARSVPPANSVPQRPPTAYTPPVPRAQQPPPPAQPPPDKKPNPDPVITKLAARASSDPELKTLMKEVATGNATPEQLKVFQKHIDELQAQIKAEREEREARERLEEDARRQRDAETAAQTQMKEEVIQYDGAGDSRTGTPTPVQYYTPQHTQYQTPQIYAPTAQQHQQSQQQQQPYTPSPTHHAVILSFALPNATEDRFLFPRHTILETLSVNHLLASFIVVRPGCDAPGLDLEPQKQYWQPITLMLEVKLGLEELLDHVKRWARPAEEVRRYMRDVMARCERAPERFLALRLPVKGQGGVETADGSALSTKEATPIATPTVVTDGGVKKSSVKYVKKASAPSALKSAGSTSTSTSATPAAARKGSISGTAAGASTTSSKAAVPESSKAKTESAAAVITAPTAGEAGEEPEGSGRPKRAVRKSVRISEG